MDWSKEVHDALRAPFPPGVVKFLPRAARNGRALALAHIDSRIVMRRLDAVVGPENWSFDWQPLAGKAVKGSLTILGVTKSDAGEADKEDEPVKSAVSDALKRCAIHFGIGRYIYNLGQRWVEYDEAARKFKSPPQVSAEDLKRAFAQEEGFEEPPTTSPAARATQAMEQEPSYAAATVTAPEPDCGDAIKRFQASAKALGCDTPDTRKALAVSILNTDTDPKTWKLDQWQEVARQTDLMLRAHETRAAADAAETPDTKKRARKSAA